MAGPERRLLTFNLRFRVGAIATGLAILVGTSIVMSTEAATAATPSGGAVIAYVVPGTTNVNQIVVIGAIGGRGTVVNVSDRGAVDPNGNFAKVTLPNGTFEINLKAFIAKLNKASYPINQASCTAGGLLTASYTVFDGSGPYKGVTGKGKQAKPKPGPCRATRRARKSATALRRLSLR
jgi:hypothetical protein